MAICGIIFSKEELSNLGKMWEETIQGERGFQVHNGLAHRKKNYGSSNSGNLDYIPRATLLPQTTKA